VEEGVSLQIGWRKVREGEHYGQSFQVLEGSFRFPPIKLSVKLPTAKKNPKCANFVCGSDGTSGQTCHSLMLFTKHLELLAPRLCASKIT
jgi:hypothetical protein